MKLLIITQIVDKNDSVLGFFHAWILEFAKQCENVIVICLKEGEHTFPNNVQVYSLGKEAGGGRLGYLQKFYSLIWGLRNEYEHVFVHMNQIYVILGAPVWRALRKKIGLWYAHGAVSTSLRLAVLCTHKVFTSTPEGLAVETSKRKVVGQGIDVEHFAYRERVPGPVLRLITVGRVSASKQIETLLEACKYVYEVGGGIHFRIIGEPITPADVVYKEELFKKSQSSEFGGCVEWKGSVSQALLPSTLYTADIFIHDGATRSLDKALLEAVSSGCVVISSNSAYAELARAHTPQFLFPSGSATALAEILVKVAKLTQNERRESMASLRSLVAREHGLARLLTTILREY